MWKNRPELDAWIRYQRERLRVIFLDILDTLNGWYIESAEWEQAEKICRRSLSVEPWQEMHIVFDVMFGKTTEIRCCNCSIQNL